MAHKIFLVGFMGSGKTTLGKRLANKLEKEFIDLDHFIVAKTGKTITEIFESEGEDYFRELETKFLQEIVEGKNNFVLSLGGGTPCFNNNINFLNDNGATVYLKYNPGILTSRLSNAKASRPIIANKSEVELKTFIAELLDEREAFYSQCKVIVEDKNITADSVIERLAQNS